MFSALYSPLETIQDLEFLLRVSAEKKIITFDERYAKKFL